MISRKIHDHRTVETSEHELEKKIEKFTKQRSDCSESRFPGSQHRAVSKEMFIGVVFTDDENVKGGFGSEVA